MIAVTRARGIGPRRDYIAQAQACGKTRTEAMRLLRRQLSNTVLAARPAHPRAARRQLRLTAQLRAA
jgi:transposase